MSDHTDPVSDDELHAWVDGQLEPARVPAVLAWLQARPEGAVRVLHWQSQRQQLRRLVRSIDPGPTPEAMTRLIEQSAAGRTRQRTPWLQAAAVLLLVAAGVAGGHRWGRAGIGDGAVMASASPVFVREAVAAHAVFVPETRHPVEVTAADEAHLVQWLSRRLGTPLKAPSLTRFGYRLLGGRLLPGESSPRAQFMYESAAGGRVTLYVAAFAPGQAPADTSFRSTRVGDEESFYWVEDRFGYALSAKLSGVDMQALAREVYAQLQR